MKTYPALGSRCAAHCFLVAASSLAFGLTALAQEPGSEEPPAPRNGSAPQGTPGADKFAELLKKADVAPIVIPKTSKTTAEFQRERLEWLKKKFIPAMKAESDGTIDTPERLAVVEKLFGWWTDTETSVVESTQRVTAFAKELNEIASPSAKAPVFQAFAGVFMAAIGQRAEAGERWRTTLDGLNPATAPALPGLVAVAGLMANSLARTNDPKLDELLMRYVKAACSPEQCTEAEAPFLVSFLTTHHFNLLVKPRAARLLPIFAEAKLPAWARETLLGEGEVQVAWSLRGSGVADKVTDAGWRGFEEHLVKARMALAKGWKLRPDCPEAATEMISVAMGGQAEEGETTRLWFDRATAAQCDYPQAYEKMRWSLRPRWGGSPLAMAAFGLACANSNRPDSMVSEQLSLALQDLATEFGDWRALFADKTLGAALVAARQERVARAATPYGKYIQNCQLALEAWLTGDYPLANAALGKMGDSRKPEFAIAPQVAMVLRKFRVDPVDFVADCRLHGGAYHEAYLSITAALEAGEWEAADRQSGELLKDAGAKEDPVLLAIGQIARFENNFYKSGWVPMPLNPRAWRSTGTNNWYHVPGEIRIASPGTTGRDLFRGKLSSRYEVRGEFLPAKDRRQMAFGFVFGASAINTNDSATFAMVSADGKTTNFSFNADTAKIPGRVDLAEPWSLPPPEQPVKVRVRRDKNVVSVWFDDRLVLDKKELPAKMQDGAMAFGFVAAGGAADDRHIFRKVEARVLGKDE